jgi:hypothetical protein
MRGNGMVQLSDTPRQTRKVAVLWTLVVGALATLVAVFALRGKAFTPPEQPAAIPESREPPVHTIVLPHDPPDLPPGPSREIFVASCTVCHSIRLVTNQPPFPRDKWAEEVHKMVTAYGAHITPPEEPQILDYLMTIRGK